MNFIDLLKQNNNLELKTFLNNIVSGKYINAYVGVNENTFTLACEIPNVWQREFDVLEYAEDTWRITWEDVQREGYYTRVTIKATLNLDVNTSLDEICVQTKAWIKQYLPLKNNQLD